MNKWGLIIKAAGITGVLLVVRLVSDYLNYDVLSLTNLITAFISGAVFTVAIIFLPVYSRISRRARRFPVRLRFHYGQCTAT
jgi:hypothetical protein